MNSRVSWSVDGIDPSVRERAEAAARRAGMSLNDWLNSSIGEPAPPNFRAPYDQRPAMPSQESRDVADIHQRLDSITRQIEQISKPAPRSEAPRAEAARAEPAVARQLNDAISRLDARLSQISNPAPARQAQMQDKQRQAEMVERAAAQVYRPSPPLSPASMDFAIAEIAARQNELDGPPPRQMPSDPIPPRHAAPMAPPAQHHSAQPMMQAAPAGPDFSSLERHLIKITSQIEALQRPDHVEQSIAAFRTELAEIRHAITEAMPRRAIESIENEIRTLSRRIDDNQTERQRRPGARRHRTRARRNPRSAALADAGRTTGRLRRCDPQSRRQARSDPALERRSVDGAAARKRDRRTSRHRFQRRLQRRAGAACRRRAHAVDQGRPAVAFQRQQRFLCHARAAHRRAELDAGEPAAAGRERQLGISRKRAALADGAARPHPGRQRQCVGLCPSRTARNLSAGAPGSLRPPRRSRRSISAGSRKGCTTSCARSNASMPAWSRSRKATAMPTRRSRSTPASSTSSSANCPTSASASRKPTAARRIRSKRFTARSAMWSIACRRSKAICARFAPRP